MKHGIPYSKLSAAHYCTVDRFEALNISLKKELRNQAREKSGIPGSSLVVGFSGKFISKKNPELLFKMLEYLPSALLQNLTLYFIGSGELEKKLNGLAQEAFEKFGVKSHFTGFVNQSKLPEHYLAIDILALPSRKMGETWGLVVNEAMQAGCGVVVSEAVGCAADFKYWDRFSVFEEGNAQELAQGVLKLSKFTRDFNWAKERLENYSIMKAAKSLTNELFRDCKVARHSTMG